jgi:hypothetical protein
MVGKISLTTQSLNFSASGFRDLKTSLYIQGSEIREILTTLGSSVMPTMLSFHSSVSFILSDNDESASLEFAISKISQTSFATNQTSPSMKNGSDFDIFIVKQGYIFIIFHDI